MELICKYYSVINSIWFLTQFWYALAQNSQTENREFWKIFHPYENDANFSLIYFVHQLHSFATSKALKRFEEHVWFHVEESNFHQIKSVASTGVIIKDYKIVIEPFTRVSSFNYA